MIDTLPSQSKVHQLLKKTKRSNTQNQQILIALKKGAFDMPDVSFGIALEIVKNKQNDSDQKFINIEQLILNAIKIKIPVTSVKKYLQHFAKSIGKTRYLQKLAAFLTFSFSSEIKREEMENIIKEDLSDLESRKRILTAYKREGRLDEYIKRLNSFLEENPSDTESWVELSQLYTERGLYLRALFCMEEVVVLHPDNEHYTVRLAQLYVTQGGKQNLKHAVKYYSHVLTRSPKNIRALWGLHRVLTLMGDKIDVQLAELKELCYDTINNQYSKRNSVLKIHVAF